MAIYFKVELSRLIGKVPNYMGSLLRIRNTENDERNIKIFAESIGAKVEYIYGKWQIVTREEEVAVKVMKVLLDYPDDYGVLYLDLSAYKVYKFAIESGFTTEDYSIVIEDNVQFIVGRKDLLTVLKLGKE